MTEDILYEGGKVTKLELGLWESRPLLHIETIHNDRKRDFDIRLDDTDDLRAIATLFSSALWKALPEKELRMEWEGAAEKNGFVSETPNFPIPPKEPTTQLSVSLG